jgi:hypothetical protein
MESGPPTPSKAPDDRIPRGAIAVVVVGLIATLAAALLSDTGRGSGEVAHLEFVRRAKIPDSAPAAVPGSKGAKMRLVEGSIKATGTNVAGYSLFRAFSKLRIDKGAPLDGGQVLCEIHAPRAETEIAHSEGGLRMLYPRSSEDGIYGQAVPESVLARFASHNSLLAVLEEVTEDVPPRWASIQGVKLGWPTFEPGTEHLLYYLPDGKAKATVVLPFYTIWKTKKAPAVRLGCKLKVDAGVAAVETEGSLPHISPPIDEEAEDIKREEREEVEEDQAAEEDEGE